MEILGWFGPPNLKRFRRRLLRLNDNRYQGEIYEYRRLCESVHTERGPRQCVVASLGKLSDEDFEAGWKDIEALLEGPTSKSDFGLHPVYHHKTERVEAQRCGS